LTGLLAEGVVAAVMRRSGAGRARTECGATGRRLPALPSPGQRSIMCGADVANQTPASRPVESPCFSIPSTPILSAMLKNRLVRGAGSVLR